MFVHNTASILWNKSVVKSLFTVAPVIIHVVPLLTPCLIVWLDQLQPKSLYSVSC